MNLNVYLNILSIKNCVFSYNLIASFIFTRFFSYFRIFTRLIHTGWIKAVKLLSPHFNETIECTSAVLMVFWWGGWMFSRTLISVIVEQYYTLLDLSNANVIEVEVQQLDITWEPIWYNYHNQLYFFHNQFAFDAVLISPRYPHIPDSFSTPCFHVQ